MKRTFLYSTVVLFLALGNSSCNSKPEAKEVLGKTQTAGGGMTIAYVNIDTLTDNLDFFKENKDVFEKDEQKLNAEIESLARNLQNEYAAFQKKVQSGALSQVEGEATQKRLQQMQQNLEERRQVLSNEFMKKQNDFNAELKKRLDAYLEKYNKDKKYDFILSHGTGSQILWANEAYDITRQIIAGMNEEAKANSGNKIPVGSIKK